MTLNHWRVALGGAITPFDSDGEIDWAALRSHVELLAASPLDGILVNAFMAEGPHLSPLEREKILSLAVHTAAGTSEVIATVYGANTEEATAIARRASALGAAALLVYPHPAFAGTPLAAEIPARYFSKIAAASELPLIVFRTPAALAPTLDAAALEILAEIDGVAAVKDSTGDLSFYQKEGAWLLEEDSPLKVLADYDPGMLPFLRAGAAGATIMSAVVDADQWVRLFSDPDAPDAEARQEALAEFSREVYAPPFRDLRARLKEALRIDGVVASASVRPPLLDLDDVSRQRLQTALSRCRAALAAVGATESSP